MPLLSIDLQGVQSRVILYPGEPQAWANEPRSPVWRDLEKRMLRVQVAAEARVRVRTGALLASIRREATMYRRYPAMMVVAGRPGMKYTMFEHDGTVPHVIEARRRKMLKFEVGGVTVFARRVQHPGTTGTFFLTRSFILAAG